MLYDQSIVSDVSTGILTGRENKRARALRRNPWETNKQGISIARGIHEASLNTRWANSSQRRLLTLYRTRLRETALRLTPQNLINICYDVLDSDLIAAFPSLVFGTTKGELDTSVQIMQLIAEARFQFAPFTIGDDYTPKSAIRATGIGVMFGSLVEQTCHGQSHTWRNFIEATILGDTRTDRPWQVIVRSLAHSPAFRYTPASQTTRIFPQSTGTVYSIQTRTILASANYLLGHPEHVVPLPIPDDQVSGIAPFIDAIVQELRDDQQKLDQVITWFQDHEDELKTVMSWMWEDIQERPQYGLRTAGDRIQLDFPPFNGKQLSYQSLVLTPTEQFPTVQAKYWIRSMGNPTSLPFTFAPNHFSLADAEGWDKCHYKARMVDMIMYFIALHSYWTIVMGLTHPSQRPESRPVQFNTMDVPAALQHSRVGMSIVRPHFRRLPPGFQASSEAAEHARVSLGITQLPQGRTFVQEHERGWGLMEEMPPVFTYKETDLRNWL